MAASLEELLGKIRAEALMRGKDWEKVAEILADEAEVSDTPDPPGARPLKRKSTSPVPTAQPPAEDPPEVLETIGRYDRRNLDFSSDEIIGSWSDEAPQCAVSAASVQRSSADPREQQCGNPDLPPAKVSCNGPQHDDRTRDDPERPVTTDPNRAKDDPERPATTDPNHAAEDNIELQIDRLLQACSAATGLPHHAAAQDGSSDMKTVWIVGDSLVYWAEDRAAKCSYGTRLGLPRDKCKVFWFDRKGLRWDQMQNLVVKAARQTPAPNILVIHAGTKDLLSTKSFNLIYKVIESIKSWLVRWPGLRVVWSHIIQQGDWCDGYSVATVAKRRKKVNNGIGKFVKANGGSVVYHERINSKYVELYRGDGIHLSALGLDVFNNSLRDMLEKYI
ncbi:uncharacterized protein LOC142251703 isoform X2 [Anomaloglossus baeobatrachus]